MTPIQPVLLVAALFLPLVPLYADAAGGVPDTIALYEEVTPSVGASRHRGDRVDVRFGAFGQDFALELEPGGVTRSGTRVVRVRADGEHVSTVTETFYEGALAGDPDAVVRMRVADGALDGVILTDGERYFVEPARRYDADAGAADTIVYRGSDTTAEPDALGCGVDGGHSLHIGTPAGSSGGARAARSAGGTKLLEMGVVADWEMFQEHGSGTESHALALMNLVDGVYMAELDVSIAVTELVIFETSSDPFTTADPSGLLNQFTDYRREPASPVGDTDLAHLLTGRNLSGSTVGIAYLDVLCSQNYGTGLSEDFSSSNFMMTLLLSHEIGHNFGAHHDGQSGPCSDAPYGFLMWPSLGGGMDDEFSQCSKDTIAPEVASASCLSEAIPPGCGDGVFEPLLGEQCDDGNNVDGDCCRRDCQFEASGSVCGDDGDQCTDDVCDGLGICTHPFNTAPCHDGEVCTTDGQCSLGVCEASTTSVPFDRVKLKAKFKNGADNDKLIVKASVPIDEFIDAPDSGGSLVEVLVDDSPVWSSVIEPGLWSTVGSSGAKYRYDEGASPPPAAGGVDRLQIDYKFNKDLVQIKVKLGGHELPGLVDQPALGLRIQVGDDAFGDCGEVFSMGCSVSPGKSVGCSF